MPSIKVVDRAIALLDVKASEIRVQLNRDGRVSKKNVTALCDLAETVVAAYHDEKDKNDVEKEKQNGPT